MYWLSSYQEDPNRFIHIKNFDFDDDLKKKLIKVPVLNKEEANSACQLLVKLQQSVPNKCFENVDARFTVQEKFQRDTICKMYQIQLNAQ